MMLTDDHPSLGVDSNLVANLNEGNRKHVTLVLRKEFYMWPEMARCGKRRVFRLDNIRPTHIEGFPIQEQLTGDHGKVWVNVGERLQWDFPKGGELMAENVWQMADVLAREHEKRAWQVGQSAKSDPAVFRAVVSQRMKEEHDLSLSGASPHRTDDVKMLDDGTLLWTGTEKLAPQSMVYDAAAGAILIAQPQAKMDPGRMVLRVHRPHSDMDVEQHKELVQSCADVHHFCVHSTLGMDIASRAQEFDRAKFNEIHKPDRPHLAMPPPLPDNPTQADLRKLREAVEWGEGLHQINHVGDVPELLKEYVAGGLDLAVHVARVMQMDLEGLRDGKSHGRMMSTDYSRDAVKRIEEGIVRDVIPPVKKQLTQLEKQMEPRTASRAAEETQPTLWDR